ncbi:MAG: AsmA-like C-terminal region-containing protein [Bacteroidota bacterium]
MKKGLKRLAYIMLTLLAIVIVLLVVAKLSERKITQMALRKVSRDIEAPVTIRDISFNLLRKFPLASIELEGVTLCGQSNTSYPTIPDTLMQIDKAYVAVKSIPLTKGIIEVVKIDIINSRLNYQVDSTGISNIDFLMATDTTQPVDTTPGKPLDITLTDLSVENLTCYYSDSSNSLAAEVNIPTLQLSGKLSGESIAGSAHGNILLSHANMKSTPLHLMNAMELKFDADYANDSIVIDQMEMASEGVNLAIEGGVKLGDTLKTNLLVQQTELSLQSLAKYLPDSLIKAYQIESVAGNIQLAGTIKGNYSSTEMPRVTMDITLDNGQLSAMNYPSLKNILLSGKITNGILQNNRTTQVDLTAVAFETPQSKFSLSLSLLDLDKPKYNLQTHMDVDLAEFAPYIPDTLVNELSGKMLLKFKTRGTMPDSINNGYIDKVLAKTESAIVFEDVHLVMDSVPAIRHFNSHLAYTPGKLSIDSLSIALPDYKVAIQNSRLSSQFSGSVDSLAKMQLNLESFAIYMGKSSISGVLAVENLEHPTYDLHTKINMNLDEIRDMLPDTLVNELSGTFTADIQSAATIHPDSIESKMMEVLFTKGAYKAEMQNISAVLPDYPDYTIADLSGKIALDRTALTINKTSGSAAGISFAIDSTRIKNLYETQLLNQPKKLEVETRLTLGDLDYNRLMALVPAEDSTETEETASESPTAANYTMEIKGVARINSFTYDSVYISNFSTLFNVQDSVYTVDQLKFDAFGGHLNTSANYIIQSGDKSVIQMRNTVNNMDIHQLLADFKDFEGFYEPTIRSANISGQLTCDFYSRLDMIGDSLLMDDMRVRGDFHLTNGGIYDFEPATELSKMTNLNELDNIQFKDLSSQLFIFQGAIYVPKTYISSTALDITAYGMQSFGEDYEYHLKLHLSDILIGKSKKLLKEQAKTGDIAEGGDRNKAVYLISYSKDGKAKNGFDKKSQQRLMKAKILGSNRLLDFRFQPKLFQFKTNVYPK